MTNKKIQIEKIYSIDLVRKNSHKMFVFGDNSVGYGKGGQAIIRDEPNSFGIPTKKSPMYFYKDDDYEKNCQQIDDAIKKILQDDKQIIVLPVGGLGTGLARLNIVAPNTWEYLCKRLLKQFKFDNKQTIKKDFL